LFVSVRSINDLKTNGGPNDLLTCFFKVATRNLNDLFIKRMLFRPQSAKPE